MYAPVQTSIEDKLHRWFCDQRGVWPAVVLLRDLGSFFIRIVSLTQQCLYLKDQVEDAHLFSYHQQVPGTD